MAQDLDIRNIVLENLSGSSRDELEGYIQETIDLREEDALPGMGILFEVVWSNSDTSEKGTMMDKIMQSVGTTNP